MVEALPPMATRSTFRTMLSKVETRTIKLWVEAIVVALRRRTRRAAETSLRRNALLTIPTATMRQRITLTLTRTIWDYRQRVLLITALALFQESRGEELEMLMLLTSVNALMIYKFRTRSHRTVRSPTCQQSQRCPSYKLQWVLQGAVADTCRTYHR